MTSTLKEMATEQLEREIGQLAAHINAATCRWLELVAELDRREGWVHWGCHSCAEWLSLRCGTSPGTAREQVRVASRLSDLPAVHGAFARGELSYSKVRAITRVGSPENEIDLLELALHCTAAQLERLTRAYRGVLATQTDRVEAVDRNRYVTWEWDDDGSLRFRGRLPAEEGALLIKALESTRDELRVSAETRGDSEMEAGVPVPDEACPGGIADRHAPGNADAVVRIAERALADGTGGPEEHDHYQVVVHVDSAALERDDAAGACEVDHGPALAPETARRLACDAPLVRILERDGRPLSVGRKTRAISPAMRRALGSRDRCCRFPGCTQRRFVDAHHIRHWAHGGETSLANLVLLCRRHHRLVHEGGFSIEQVGRDVRFRRPDGRAIRLATRTRGDCGSIERMQPLATPETPAAQSHGLRLRVGDAVERLLAADHLLDADVSAETRAPDRSPLPQRAPDGSPLAQRAPI